MAKQLNVDLRFNADVGAAKAQLQSLQASINQLTTSMVAQGAQLGITSQIQGAQQAAVQLKTALAQSMNVDTGKFDLSKFNSSLKSMNTDLGKLKTQLMSVGPAGQQTFMSLAQSIMSAEIPTKRISASLAALGTTLKNTAKWQLSSTMLHGFMGAVQTSYRYAQDLNQSLNNIRIVTGESASAMEQFAAKANKAAKALSASTLDYTDAALIFYQQGLKGKDVEDRTEVTLKMANVSRQSAEIVSDQMTAIWNNFHDGSKSLEYYADVLTALGAATASSTDEIAGGLEKFAAIGDTIGLSYEYAAAALATITANTRQSEEVVGTALKTIFARMEGLKLGETLEDGVELNKYSEALQTIGVHIFDANHELKNMDTILDETAAKWSTLSRHEQTALAQTVAGVRQYNQFIALMDNWNDGSNDSMKANLETINNSSGALQKQADIYAESWEAASKRVKASAEGLYTSILDDDFFIDLSNGFADLLDDIKVFTKAIGGVKGILLGLAGILLNTFSGAAAQGLENMVYNLKSFMGIAQQDAMKMKNQVAGMLSGLSTDAQLTNQQQGSLIGMQRQVELQNEINHLSSKWTDQQKLQAQGIMEANKLYGEQVALLGEAADKANQQKQTSKNNMLEQTLGNTQEFRETLTKINKDVDISSNLIEQANKLEQEFAEGKIEAKKFGEEMDKLSKKARNSGLGTLASDFHRGAEKPEGKKKILADAEAREDNRSKREIYARRDITRKRSYSENNPNRNRGMRGVGNEELEDYIRNAQGAKGAANKFAEGQKTLEEATAKAKQELQNLNNASRSWSQTAVGVAQGMSSIGFGVQSLSSMFKTLTDDSASFSDKLLSAFTGLGMALPMLINGFNSLKTAIIGSNTVMTLSVALGKADVTTLNAQQLAKMTGMTIEEASQALKALAISQTITEITLIEGVTDAEKAKRIAKLTGMSVEKAEIIIEKLRNGETLKSILLGEISLKTLAKKTLATITHTAALIKQAVATAIAKAVTGDFSGVIILATAAVIAGTAALVGYAAAQEQQNQKISEAKEQLNAATEAYEQATQRAKEFKEAITGYEEAVDSLKDLVSGTDEYTEALKKANAEATKMIDMYPDMKYTIENGLIKISSADYQEHYKKLQNQAEMFDTIRIQAEAGVKKAENEKSFKQITKDLGNDFGIQNYQGLKGTQGGYSHDIQGVNYKDEFVKALQHKSYEDQKDLLNNKTALKELFSQIKLDNKGDLGTEAEFEKWADNIVNASESEKEAILNNISALRENTAALQAEVEANQQQKYGERFVAEHGTAEIYGAEIEIAKQKKSDIDWDAKEDGKQSSYADYIDDIMNLYNNTEHLTNKSATDAAMVAKIFGIEEGSFDGRELRVRQGDKTAGESGTVYLTGDKTTGGYNSEKDSDLKMSIEEFDARAAVISNKLTITEQEIDTLLKSAEGREKAKQMALDSGLYDYRDMLVTSDQTDVNADKTYDLMTVGQKEDLTKRFESEQLTQETEQQIINYLSGVDSSIKQKVADKLLQMSDEQLNAMDDEDFAKLSKEETDAFYSRDIGRLAQDEANIYGIDPGTLKDVAEGFREMGEAGDEVYKNIKDDSQALVDAARNYIRLNTAIQDIKENYEDYSKVIKGLADKNLSAVDKAMIKNSESAKKLRKTFADLLDTSENLVDSDLLEAIDPKDFEKAAQGDIKAIGRIRDAFIDLQVKGIQGIDAQDFKDELNALAEGADIEVNVDANVNLDDYIADLVAAELAAGASELDIESKLSGMGISIDGMQFFDTLAEAEAAAAQTGGIVVDNLSFDTTQETGQTEVEGNMPDTTFTETLKYNRVPWEAKVMQDDATETTPLSGWGVAGTKTTKSTITPNPFKNVFAGVGQTVSNGAGKTGKKGKFAVINGAKKKAGNSYNPNFGSNKGNPTGGNGGNGGSGGNGGGGGGDSKPAKKSRLTLKKEVVERYKELNDQLRLIQDSVEDISKEMENAWGPNRIKLMRQYQKELSKEIEVQKKIREQIKGTIWEDQQAIKDFMKQAADGEIGGLGDLGLSFEFDDNTLAITNYDEIMSILHAKLNEYEAAKNAMATEEEQSAYDESTLAPFKEKVDYIKDLISTYDETVNAFIEKKNEVEDKINERMQSNLDELQYKIEIDVEINEQDLENLEHVLERFSDNDPYVTAERIAIISQKAIEQRQIADAQLEGMREAERLYKIYLSGDKEHGISQQAYMEKIQEAKETIMEAERLIQEGIEATREELENVFDLADERLDRHFEKFDQLLEVMEHYKNVISLVEGEASYENLNELLKASQQVLRDRIEADKSEVAMWKGRRAQLEAQIATLPENSSAKREAEEALQVIMEKEAEAKSQLMADIEQLGEYAREIFENAIEQAIKDFEDEMFDRPLNSIIEGIEMMNSRQEELLTTTNKIYETNKLIRNVEKDIEATTNLRAKQAYAEFQNKVKQKQEQNQLTQFELDLLTAEYEMTKAQIALEEAQNAKDTVRLTRDSEGNYGYVYTANEDKVADAEQALDDATNNYYNTALDGAQKYQDQIYQHIQEWEEKLKEVYLDQTLSEEEKNKKIEEINSTYNTLIRQDKELYYMAVGAMQEESYNNQVDYDLKGIKSAEKWFTESKGFLKDLESAQDDYEENTEEVAGETEGHFGTIEEAIADVTTESENLRDEIVNRLTPELDTTLKDSIDKATEAWRKYIEALQEAIRLSDNMMKKQHDTNLKENYKEDYAAQIQQLLDNGASYSDYDIQRLLEFRWEKIGGVDNTDYSALIEAGGTASEMRLWEVLRKFKIEQTDWSAYREANPNATWTDSVRAEKLDQDYAQLIYDYLASSPYGRWNDSQVQKYLSERQVKIDENNLAGQVMSNEELKEKIAKKLKKEPEELLTGGYTGDWGPEGRLAVLHEKELVLNKQDTENFLSATNILREISQMLDRDALIASLGAINLRAMTLNSPADQVLQQEVTIHADFPNVTDHNEIELAIDNLINAASQHAYKL